MTFLPIQDETSCLTFRGLIEPAFFILRADTGRKTLSRVMSELESGALDIIWTATDCGEDEFLSMRIPLDKGNVFIT